jgi:hypothetical protein
MQLSLRILAFAFSALVLASPVCRAASSPTHAQQSHANATKDLGSEISPYSPGSNNLALDIGQVFLMGDLGERYSDSIGGQLHYTYGVSDLFGFDGSVGYSGHSNGKFSMASALFGLRTNLSYYDRLVPYSIFGLGFYKPSYSYLNASNTGEETLSPVLFGIHLGLGMDLIVTNEVFFGAGLTLHDVFGGDRDIPGGKISVGGTYTSFLLHAGYTF